MKLTQPKVLISDCKKTCMRNRIIFCLCLDGCSKFAPKEMMLCEFEADAE